MQREGIVLTTYFIVGLVFISLFLVFANARDAKLNEWVTRYEQCVSETYRTTPTQYYLEHGNYPECQL